MSLPSGVTGSLHGLVEGVAAHEAHAFPKPQRERIALLDGLGIEGDAHCGVTVKHRSRVAVDPTQPNIRQVHLIQGELHDELLAAGFDVGPGVMGENITTRGMDLLGLPRGTRLHIGASAIVEVTGLRNPCPQMDAYQTGLTAATLDRDPDGALVRKAGIMGIVVLGGEVLPGDRVVAKLPDGPHVKLERV